MTLLVFSDSHGRRRNIEDMLHRQLELPRYVLCLGDGIRDAEYCEFPERTELVCVRGNCDIFSDGVPNERLLAVGGYRILMMHGHTRGVKSGMTAAIAEAVRQSADLLLFGHTHVPLERTMPLGSAFGGVTLEKPLHIFNPGSLAEASFGAITLGEHGILMSHGKLFE